ncbi:MAG: sensor histidine kinase, partial [Candidatus Limnocylindrales bacterium]
MRRSFALTAILAAMAMSLVSLVTAVTGEVEVGVVAQDPGGVVLDVVPDGAGWAAGIRPGQRVVSLAPATDPSGWAIQTDDGTSLHRVSATSADAALRPTAGASLVACLLVLLAIRDSRSRSRRTELLTALALVLAVAPFLVATQPVATGAAVAGAGVAPVVWLARWRPLRRATRYAMVGSAVVISLAWGVARTQPVPELRLVGDVWGLAVVAGTAAMLLVGSGVTAERALRAVAAVRLLDAAVVAVSVMAGAVAYAVGLPALWAGVVGLIPMLAYARSRQAIRGSLDRLLLAELRERAAIQATEAERARMAREIHDDPLQAIAGVIQKLEEPAPDTGSARDSLRAVAARLRGVATELHPPILDDLGLVPAIEAAARGSGDGPPVTVRIEDGTGYSRAERPPADVE